MPKGKPTHGAKKASRSYKHKDHNPKRLVDDSASMDMDEKEVSKQQQKKAEEEESKDDMDDGEETGSVNSAGGKSLADYAPNMISKEKREAIRKDRQKRNRKMNLYKIRNGNCTGKNGPRAINRVSSK
jgi:hypothetical protein